MKKTFFLLYIFFAFSVFGADDYPQIRAVADKKESTVGMPVIYKITLVTDKEGIKSVVPDNKFYFLPKDTSTPPDSQKQEDKVPLYEILSMTEDLKNDQGVYHHQILVTAVYYRTGTYQLPDIKILDTDGKTGIGYKIPEINIVPVNKEGKFEEAEPPLDLGGNYNRLIIIIIASALIGIAVFLVVKRIMKKKLEKASMKETVHPIVVFKAEIELLKSEDLVGKGRVEEYIFRLSAIFRKFLSTSLKTDTVEMTNEEIYALIEFHVKSESMKHALLNDMRRIMDLWDLAKFAEFVPSADTLERNLSDLENFVGRVNWEENNVRY